MRTQDVNLAQKIQAVHTCQCQAGYDNVEVPERVQAAHGLFCRICRDYMKTVVKACFYEILNENLAVHNKDGVL